ncbi:MAG: hypothetical protein U0790_24530 [Isosphaeraceae bacterium]
MLRTKYSLAFVASLALGIGFATPTQAGRDDLNPTGVLKGNVEFLDESLGPLGGFQSDDLQGRLRYVGRTTAEVVMKPQVQADGTVALGGVMVLADRDGDQIRMEVVAEDVSIVDGKRVSTATLDCRYQIVGGTGRFVGVDGSARFKITIRCDWVRRRWTITIEL